MSVCHCGFIFVVDIRRPLQNRIFIFVFSQTKITNFSHDTKSFLFHRSITLSLSCNKIKTTNERILMLASLYLFQIIKFMEICSIVYTIKYEINKYNSIYILSMFVCVWVSLRKMNYLCTIIYTIIYFVYIMVHKTIHFRSLE